MQGQRAHQFSVSAQQKDFALLKHALLNHFAGVYLYADSTLIDQKIKAVETALETPKSDLELYRLYAQLLSETHCGHSQIWPNKKVFRSFFFSACSLPFDVILVDKRLYALSGFGKSPRVERYDEITKINGQSIAEVLDVMYQYINGDAHSNTLKDQMFKDFFLLYYYLAFPKSDVFEIEFTSQDSTQVAKLLPKQPPIKKYLRKMNQLVLQAHEVNYGRLKVVQKDNYAVLKLPSFYRTAGGHFHAWVDLKFKQLQKSGVQNLVIDLRGNGGGNFQDYLFGYLTDSKDPMGVITCKPSTRPKRIRRYKRWDLQFQISRFDMRRKKRALSRGELPKPKKIIPKNQPYTYDGQLYVLVDGGTFSAAANLAANLQDKCNATIIGTESGGGYSQGSTGLMQLKLPKSKFTTVVNPLHYSNEVKQRTPENRGVLPDHIVHEKFPQARKEDQTLQVAIDLIQGKKGKIE